MHVFQQKRNETADQYERRDKAIIITHQMLTGDEFIVSKTLSISDISMSKRLNMSTMLSGGTDKS